MSHPAPFTLDWFKTRPRTPFFCEENVWLTCRDAPWSDHLRAVVISNEGGAVAMWAQRAAAADPIVWDYHVVAVVEDPSLDAPVVIDVDCRDGTLLPLPTWLRASFRSGVRDKLMPRFRLIQATDYVEVLASDRRHMRDDLGRPLQPFPPWPPPHPERPPTLPRLIDVHDDIAGVVVDVEGLCRTFGLPPVPLPPFVFPEP